MSRARQKSARDGQRGNTIVVVTAVGAACTLILSAVMNNTVVVEDRAIETELAEMRAYWGAMGHFQYALSRVRYSETCIDDDGCDWPDKGKDTDKAAVVQAYLNEIAPLSRLTYAEEADAYFIDLDFVADTDDTPGRHLYSGHLMITSQMAESQSGIPALEKLAPRLDPFEIRFCVGLYTAGSSCGPVGSNNGGYYSEYLSVKRLVRVASN